MAVGAVVWGPRVLRRLFGKHEEIVAVERMTAGQVVRLESIRPPTRKERKALKRAR
jgi:hypothetical protein